VLVTFGGEYLACTGGLGLALLSDLREVDTAIRERCTDRVDVHSPAVRAYLDAVPEARREVSDECVRRLDVALARQEPRGSPRPARAGGGTS
jgi:hypothetical protein